MEKTKQNSTVDYAPQQCGEKTEVKFTKTTNSSGTSVFGRILTDGSERGSISYDTSRGNLLIQVKDFGSMPEADRGAVCSNAPGWIEEIISEE